MSTEGQLYGLSNQQLWALCELNHLDHYKGLSKIQLVNLLMGKPAGVDKNGKPKKECHNCGKKKSK